MSKNKLLKICIWLIRIFVGLTFIISGLVKSIDLWGFVYKIEEYLSLWDFIQPRSLIFITAFFISGFEFVLGIMLMVGNYRRMIPILMLLTMCFMLPLTAYIWIKNPVADCGCFGDFIIISNTATFFKNVLLTALIIVLIIYNQKVNGLYGVYIQWFSLVLSIFYIIIIGIIGYNIQPLIDFRSFPEGTDLLSEQDIENDVVDFIYEKDNKREIFTLDNLPDSTWHYVGRKEINVPQKQKSEFFILDGTDNITDEVIDTTKNQLLIVIPDYKRADASYTYLFNELDNYISEIGGTTVGLIGGDSDDIEEWIDLSMAEYPVYSAEPTLLKELIRGVMSVVYLEKGRIKWKRTASSIDEELFENNNDKNLLETLYFDGIGYLRNISIFYFSILGLIFLLDRSGRLIKWQRRIKKHRLGILNSSFKNK